MQQLPARSGEVPARDQEDHGDGEGPLIAAGHQPRRRPRGHAGQLTVTVVPAPGRLAIAARPPAASIRPVIDSRMPRRDGGVAAGSNPWPRSVILTIAQPAPPVTVTSAWPVPACRSTLRSASPTQPTSWSATGDGTVTGTSFSRTARSPVLAAARSSSGLRSVSGAGPSGSAGASA